MKNKNTDTRKAILNYMTWSSPLNQAFMIEALAHDNITFEYGKGDTNITKVKQCMKLFGPKRILTALMSYASEICANEDHLRESMKNHFISFDAWLKCATEALDIDVNFSVTECKTACA